MSDNWFTIDKIHKDTFAISEYGHWEHTHQYLFIGTQRAALIDTGLGVGNLKDIVDSLTSLPVIILTTHAHWDHTGGHGYFQNIAVHELDKDWIEHGLPLPLESIRENFAKQPLTKTPPRFNLSEWKPYTGKVQTILHDLDTIDLGNRKLAIIHTPGHSPGHIAIYEKETGLLATGDLLYEGTLDAYYESTNPLAFFHSLKKLHALPNINKLLPGHHRLNIPTDYLNEAIEGFKSISNKGLLYQGSGMHRFEHINIHL